MNTSERKKELLAELKSIKDQEFEERCKEWEGKGFKVNDIQFTIARRDNRKLFAIGFWKGMSKYIYVRKNDKSIEDVKKRALEKLGVKE